MTSAKVVVNKAISTLSDNIIIERPQRNVIVKAAAI